MVRGFTRSIIFLSIVKKREQLFFQAFLSPFFLLLFLFCLVCCPFYLHIFVSILNRFLQVFIFLFFWFWLLFLFCSFFFFPFVLRFFYIKDKGEVERTKTYAIEKRILTDFFIYEFLQLSWNWRIGRSPRVSCSLFWIFLDFFVFLDFSIFLRFYLPHFLLDIFTRFFFVSYSKEWSKYRKRIITKFRG